MLACLFVESPGDPSSFPRSHRFSVLRLPEAGDVGHNGDFSSFCLGTRFCRACSRVSCPSIFSICHIGPFEPLQKEAWAIIGHLGPDAGLQRLPRPGVLRCLLRVSPPHSTVFSMPITGASGPV